jgi:hypothetical protein
MNKILLPGLIFVLIASINVSAAVRTVPDEYTAIQSAINASNNGDKIIVKPGTYAGNIDFHGKNITVSSTEPENPDIVAATIIQGDNTSSVVTFVTNESNDAILTGFTIKGGYGQISSFFGEYCGGGIYCYYASPTISNNVIANNNGIFDSTNGTYSYGGGICCIYSNAIITRNIIKDNSAYLGGGMMTYFGNPIISDNIINNNTALIGGGLFLYGGYCVNNTIAGNSATMTVSGQSQTGEAGNLYLYTSLVSGVCNNIICNAASGGGIYYYGTIGNIIDQSSSTPQPVFRYNNVWGNQSENYYSSTDLTGKYGNISVNPQFLANYHIGKNSPCYNTGDPNYVPFSWQRDIDGEYQIMGLFIDIGADEVTDNVRPIAKAGPDQFYDAISDVNNIILNGTGSFDPDQTADITYHWQQVSGTPVILTNADSAEPNFAPPAEDVYFFELTVFDSNLYSRPDRVMIVVGNRAPIAVAGVDQVCEPGQQITLNGQSSYDLDDDDLVVGYSWKQVSGPSGGELLDPNNVIAHFTPHVTGQYVFELVVSDGLDSSVPDTITLFCRYGSMPDAYGYSWIDSDKKWGPAFDWIDIRSTGTMITGIQNQPSKSFGPYPMGFNFNFYGNTYDMFYIQSCGLISFGSQTIDYNNQYIPQQDSYNNLIAWMWTVMYPLTNSKLYYKNFPDYTVIQFVDYTAYFNNAALNAEVILYKNGRILIQFKDYVSTYETPSFTIGIENSDGTVGTQVVYNNYNYVHDKLAVEFTTGSPYVPRAHAGEEQQHRTIELITLDGTGSNDRDPNDILTYQWTQKSGPAVTLSDPAAAKPTFMPPTKGEYVFHLVVSDGTYTTPPDEVLIVIGNRAPIADAGDSKLCQPGGSVTLNGSKSYDLDKIDTITSYNWTQVSGPAGVLTDANTVSPSFTPSTTGEYVFELVVSDGELSSQPDTVRVYCEFGSLPDNYGYRWIDSDNVWGPKFHWIDISNVRTKVTGLQNVSSETFGPFGFGFDFPFYGTKYNKFYIQSNGVISFNNETFSTSNQIIPTKNNNNFIAWMWTYMYPLTGSKIYYTKFSDYFVIQFVDYTLGNGGLVNAEVILYKSGKIIIQYKDFSEGASLYQHTIGIQNTDGTDGLQVSYNNSNYLHDELAIEISLGPPYEPVANAGPDQRCGTGLITLDGTGSKDRDLSDVLTYQWTQTAGTSVVLSDSTALQPTFTTDIAGEYRFQLVVSDGTFQSKPDEVIILVGNRAPVADAGDDKICSLDQQITLDGSGSYDLDSGDTMTYTWAQVSGPSVELTNPNTAAASFTASEIGVYVFSLVVNDGSISSEIDTVSVTCTYGSSPDAYGYSWIDNSVPCGPRYNWIDIQSTGTQVTGINYRYDGSYGPFPLGFNFNFYGNSYDNFYIQASGLITFTSKTISFNNRNIPQADGYDNLIAWFWTLLFPQGNAKLYYQNFTGYTVIQFVDYDIGYGGTVNAEVILYESGKIVIQYQDFSDDAYLSQYTIGIENSNGTTGLEVAYNDINYLHDELAVEFVIGPPYEPTANAGEDQYLDSLGLVTLDGTGSADRDPDDVLTYQWTQVDGPEVTLSDPTSAQPSFMPAEYGVYLFQLIVSDGTLSSLPDEVEIIISDIN